MTADAGRFRARRMGEVWVIDHPDDPCLAIASSRSLADALAELPALVAALRRRAAARAARGGA